MSIKSLNDVINNRNIPEEQREKARRAKYAATLNYRKAEEAGVVAAARNIAKAKRDPFAMAYRGSNWEKGDLRVRLYHPAGQDTRNALALEVSHQGQVVLHDFDGEYAAPLGRWSNELLAASKEMQEEEKRREEVRRERQSHDAAMQLAEFAAQWSVDLQALPSLPEPEFPIGSKVCWTKSRQPRTEYEVNSFDPITGTYSLWHHGEMDAVVPEDELYDAAGPKVGDVGMWRHKDGNRPVTILSYEGNNTFNVEWNGEPNHLVSYLALYDCREPEPESKPTSELTRAMGDDGPWWEDGAYHDCPLDQLNELVANGIPHKPIATFPDPNNPHDYATRVRIFRTTAEVALDMELDDLSTWAMRHYRRELAHLPEKKSPLLRWGRGL